MNLFFLYEQLMNWKTPLLIMGISTHIKDRAGEKVSKRRHVSVKNQPAIEVDKFVTMSLQFVCSPDTKRGLFIKEFNF